MRLPLTENSVSTQLHHLVLLNKEKTRTKMLHNQKMYFIQMLRYGSLYYLCAVMAGFEPAISSVTSWHPRPTERHHQVKNKFDLGWVLTLIASCSLSFRNKVLIAQDLYTPISLLVRRIRLDLWCFHQDYHSHYTTLYSHVQAKDSCRIRRMPPPALSLLTILLLHLASSIRLHITKRCRSITAFSSSVGNTFACY